MSISLDKFRAKLVIKILYATSAQETERFIRAAIGAMKRRKVNGYIIMRFTERVINQLNTFNSLQTNQLQWNNIIAARTTLLQIKERINIPAAVI